LLLAFFAYLKFYFAKTGKNGLNARMEQKKSREKSLDYMKIDLSKAI